MKITAVETTVREVPVKHPFRWRAGLSGSGASTIAMDLVIRTDEGISGRAQVSHGRVMEDIVDRRLREMLIGRDPLMKEDLFHRVLEIDRLEEIPIYGLGVVDVALWDITAKVAGLPVYKVIGGYRDRIPVYASTVTYDTVEEYLDVADQCLARGFRAIKLHAWGDARKDGHLGQKLREHVGPEIALMYDGSAGFDLIDAIWLGRALGEADYTWYEEPMREFSVESYARLREKVDVPLLVGETSDGIHYNIGDFLAFKAGDLVRTSTHYKGGITGGLRVAHLADAFNTRAEVHGGGLPNLHLACAIPNTTWYESLVMGNPVVFEDGIDEQAMIGPPDVPGIGWESHGDMV